MGSKNCKKVGREFQECDKRVIKRKRVVELIRWLQEDYIRYVKGLQDNGIGFQDICKRVQIGQVYSR